MKSYIFLKNNLLMLLLGVFTASNLSVQAVDTVIDNSLDLAYAGAVATGPTAKAATKIGTTSFQANWEANKGADGYRLYVYTLGKLQTKKYVTGYNPKAVAGGTTISATISGLEMGTTYYYALTAVSGRNETDLSNVISLKTLNTPPDAPVATAATNVLSTSFQVNWEASTGASAYKLYLLGEITGQPGSYSHIDGYNGKVITGTSFAIPENTLEPGTNHYYFVRATNSVGESSESNSINIKTLVNTFEANEATNITTNSFQANWEVVEGATRYRVDVRDNAAQEYLGTPIQIDGGSNNSCVQNGLDANKYYSYVVYAYTDKGKFATSTWVTLKTLSESLPAPEIRGTIAVRDSSFYAGWNRVENAIEYELTVYVKNEAGDKEYLDDYNPKTVGGSFSGYDVVGLNPTTTYYWYVKAVGSGGVSDESDTEVVTTYRTGTSWIDAINITATSCLARWSPVEGATGYKLWVKNESYECLDGFCPKNITETSCAIEGLLPNSDYTLAIVVMFSAEGSAINSHKITTQKHSVLLSASPEVGGTVMGTYSYDENILETLYTAQANANDGYVFVNWTKDGTEVSTDASYTFKLDENTTLVANFKLAAPATPEIEGTTNVEDSSFYARWNSVGNATEYKLTVYFMDEAGDKVFLEDYNPKILNNNFTGTHVSDLNPTTTYYWYLQAANSSGTSEASETQTVTTKMSGTSSLTITDITATSCQISWSLVPGALTYNLWVEDNNDEYLDNFGPKDFTGTSFLLEGLEPNSEYYIAVSVVFISGESVRTPSYKITTQKHNVLLSASPEVGGTVMGTYSYDENILKTLLTAQATANAGYEFVNWTEGGIVVSTEASYAFALTEDRNLVANFANTAPPAAPEIYGTSQIKETSFWVEWRSVENASEYKLTLYYLNDSGDTIYVDSYNPKIVSGQLGVSVTGLEPNTIYYWYVRASNSNGDSEKSNLQGVKTSMAEEETNTLSLSAVPVAGGIVSGGGTVNSGTSVTAQAAANDGYTFVNWTENGIEVSTSSTYNFALNDDRILVANFSITTSIDYKYVVEFTIFPNPTTGKINVFDIPNGASLKVTSLLGQVLFHKNNCKVCETLNMEYFKSGIYFIIIEDETVRYSKKVIKR